MILLVMIALTPLWIYYDATKHKIGVVKGDKDFLNMPAGGWAGLVAGGIICSFANLELLLWFIVIFLYLFKRRELIKKAKTSPVEISLARKMTTFFLLLSLPAYLVWNGYSSLVTQSEPASSAVSKSG